MPRRRKYGFSWSWRRATGLSSIKGRASRGLGIPLTRYGRQRKAGQMMGCLLPFSVLVLASAIALQRR